MTAVTDALRQVSARLNEAVKLLEQYPSNEYRDRQWFAEVSAAQEAARAALAEAEKGESELVAALQHISEYWNRDENDMAMNDALYHMIDTADAALAKHATPEHYTHQD